jgi:DNA polymerase-3 subunit delta'
MDVFERLVGQEKAVATLRAHLAHPVHAFLFHGPAGANVHDAMVSFAAALQCPVGGCGSCDVCRRVLTGAEADVIEAQREGVSWLIDDVHEIERVARRRPLSCPYVVVLIDEVELTVGPGNPSAAALLKTLEEPPSRTIFLLGVNDLSDELATIESRCVTIPVAALSAADIGEILQREEVDPEVATVSADASGGDLERARLLARDPGVASRQALWRSVPERLDGTASGAMRLVDEIHAAIDDALQPLQERQAAEERRRSEETAGSRRRSGPPRADVERRHRREVRRARIDELRFGLVTLTQVYRQRVGDAVFSPPDPRVDQRMEISMAALEVVELAYRRTSTTLDEVLLLSDLFLQLGRL